MSTKSLRLAFVVLLSLSCLPLAGKETKKPEGGEITGVKCVNIGHGAVPDAVELLGSDNQPVPLALVVSVYWPRTQISLRLMLPGEGDGFMPLQERPQGSGTWDDYILSKDKSACGYVGKIATKNQICNCLVVTPDGGIHHYMDLNAQAELQIESSKAAKRIFGPKVYLERSWISEVRPTSVTLYAYLDLSPGDHRTLAYKMRLNPDGTAKVISWHLGEKY